MKIFGFPAGPFQTNCYVATGAAEIDGIATPCVVIDPGMGAFELVQRECEQRNWIPEAVLLTHGHIDHIRDVAEVVQHWDIPVFIHENDKLLLADPRIASGSQFAELFEVDQMKQIADIETYVDGEELKYGGLSFQVIHAPGHSPGCVMLRAGDGEDEIIFSGDVLFKGAIGRVDLPGGEARTMQESLQNKVLPLDDALTILPGHGGASTIGVERQTNPFLVELTR